MVGERRDKREKKKKKKSEEEEKISRFSKQKYKYAATLEI